jgi:hypothetical protein
MNDPVLELFSSRPIAIPAFLVAARVGRDVYATGSDSRGA